MAKEFKYRKAGQPSIEDIVPGDGYIRSERTATGNKIYVYNRELKVSELALYNMFSVY